MGVGRGESREGHGRKGEKCTGGVEFEIFLEVGMAEVALEVVSRRMNEGCETNHLRIHVYDNVVTSVRHCGEGAL